MNSRHPDPRRAWKGGPEQQLMTPDWEDWQDRLHRLHPRMSSQPMIPLRTSIKKTALGPPMDVQFQGFATEEPQGTPRRPKGSQRDPKGAPRHPKKAQRQHPGGTKGAQWRPRGTQSRPLAPQREFKGGLYTQKLPINRTSGRCVHTYS